MDAAVAELADRQHGVVARFQLLELGIGRRAIEHRIEVRRLHRVHRGVYAVGHRRLSRHGWWLAAVLACGRGAVLSHRSAAALWGMRERSPERVDVSVVTWIRPHDGIRPRQAHLAPDERTVHAGIPVTTVPRTLLDLAAVLQPHELDKALEQAELRGLSDPTPLVTLVERHRGRRGVAALRSALDAARCARRSPRASSSGASWRSWSVPACRARAPTSGSTPTCRSIASGPTSG